MQYPEGDQAPELDQPQNDGADGNDFMNEIVAEITLDTSFDPAIYALMEMDPKRYSTEDRTEWDLVKRTHKIAKKKNLDFEVAREMVLAEVFDQYKSWKAKKSDVHAVRGASQHRVKKAVSK